MGKPHGWVKSPASYAYRDLQVVNQRLLVVLKPAPLKRKWSVYGMNPSKNAHFCFSIYTSKSIDACSLPLQQTCSKRFGVWPPPRPWTPRRRLDVRESFAEIRGTAVLGDHSAENLGVLRGL